MENTVLNYTFTIIEDAQVPLAATVPTSNGYMPVIFAIAIMGIVAGLVAYTVWFMSHRAYIINLVGNTEESFKLYYIHPGKLLQKEYEIENTIANKYIA